MDDRETPDFSNLGQRSQQFGSMYREVSNGARTQHLSLGWLGPGADPKRTPFRDQNLLFSEERDHDNRPAAFLGMTRTKDQHDANPVADADYSYDLREDGHQQGTMVDSEPGKPWTIDEMYSTRGHAHAVRAMMGLAAQHSLRESARLPEASSDLSEHSARIVDHLSERGVIEAPKKQPRNSIDLQRGNESSQRFAQSMEKMHSIDPSWTHMVPDSEIEQGATTLRDVLRGAKKAGRSAEFQHTQEPLPGL